MKKEILSIPNIIGYCRILSLPVFLYQYYHADTIEEYIATFVFLAVIFLSDAVDGFIARKYNMITNLGKILDPVADKLVQGCLAIAVSFRNPTMKIFFAVFVCKELYMGFMGLYLLKSKDSINGAQWYGKVCTAVVDVFILILLFVPTISLDISELMIGIMVVLEIFSLGMYIRFHRSVLHN